MVNRSTYALLLAALSTSMAWAAPGDYDPAYDQGGGYGAATLDERVAKLEKKLSGDSQAELLNHVQQLQSDIQRLRGEVESLSHQLDTAKRQQKEQYLDLDRRLQALATPAPPPPEQTANATETPPAEPEAAEPAPTLLQIPAPNPPPVTPPAAAPATTAPPAPTPAFAAPPPESGKQPPPVLGVSPRALTPAVPSAESPARQAAYQKGFNLMKDGKYTEAAKELKNFLAVYPRGELSDNAAYWLAEAYYVNRDLAAARESFHKVVKDFPQAVKVADAQLKLGYIDYESGQWAAARDSLGEVIKRYPDSSAAKLAQKRLDKMKQEGR